MRGKKFSRNSIGSGYLFRRGEHFAQNPEISSTRKIRVIQYILELTTRLDTSSMTLFVRDSLTHSLAHSLREEDVHVTSNVERRVT